LVENSVFNTPVIVLVSVNGPNPYLMNKESTFPPLDAGFGLLTVEAL